MLALGQATPANQVVPETIWALPAVPLVRVTTAPWLEEFEPTASQLVAVEQAADLVHVARDRLSAVGAANATVVQNALVEGAKTMAPYDVIVVEGGIEEAPQTLLSQLGEGGRLVAVLQQGAYGRAHLFVRENGRVGSRPDFDASAPALVGFHKSI